MSRKMLRNVEKRRVQAARNGPSLPPTPAGGPVAMAEMSTADRLGSVQGKGRAGPGPRRGGAEAGRVRQACDDAPLSISVRLCDAPYLLAPGKRGWPLTSPWPLFSRSTPHAAGRKLGLYFLLDSTFFVLSHSLTMVNTMGKLALFWRFSSTASPMSSISLATGS